MMKKLRIIVGFIAILSACVILSADIVLVRNGEGMAEIIVAPDAPSGVKLAADDLQTHIEKISGAKLPIVSEPENAAARIFVGRSSHTDRLGITTDDLKSGGFRIVARENFLVLIGHDNQHPPPPYGNRGDSLKEWQAFAGENYSFPGTLSSFNKELDIFHDDETATLYAVSEFLEQQGVRWYHPYEHGTIIPARKTITVPEQDLSREPVFPCRNSSYYGTMRSDNDGVMWFKRLKYGVAYGILVGHTTGDVLGWGERMEERPEFFARVDGQLIKVPRLTNPGFRRSALNFLDKIIEAWPWIKYVNMAPTDGLGRIDDEDAAIWSRVDSGGLGKFSDYVWDFWLHIAEELRRKHPGIFIRCNSYSPYAEPPTQVKYLPDNVALCIAQQTSSSFLPTSPAESLRRKWLPMLTSKKLFIYDYFLFYRRDNPRYPVFFTRHLQKDMQALKGICEGKIIEVFPAAGKLACPGLTHMLHYLQGKLYWDPDLDLQALMDEYYRLYFGPAWREMKTFYEFAEEVWMRPESRSISTASGFLRNEDIDRYFELLSGARLRAGADTVYDARISEIETEMQPLKKLFPMVRVGPRLEATRAATIDKLDGNLDKPFWQEAPAWYPMDEWKLRNPVPPGTGTSAAFRLTTDPPALVIGVKCDEPDMASIRVRAKEHDDFDIFEEDRIELRIETPERSFFKLAVNTVGLIWDETFDVTLVERDTLPVLWNPGTRAAVARDESGWSVEIMIPTADFGKLGPTREHPWGINVLRIRRVGGVREVYDLAPTSEALPNQLWKLGNLEVKQ